MTERALLPDRCAITFIAQLPLIHSPGRVTMPRKKAKGPNKSAAIREYLDQNKRAKPKEIVAAMKEKGLDVSPQMVSTIKTKYKGRRRRKMSGQEVGNGLVNDRRGRPRKSGKVSIEQLIAVKRLADQVGGVQAAREALDVLAKLS